MALYVALIYEFSEFTNFFFFFLKSCIFWLPYAFETQPTNSPPNDPYKEKGVSTGDDLIYIDTVNVCLQISI